MILWISLVLKLPHGWSCVHGKDQLCGCYWPCRWNLTMWLTVIGIHEFKSCCQFFIHMVNCTYCWGVMKSEKHKWDGCLWMWKEKSLSSILLNFSHMGNFTIHVVNFDSWISYSFICVDPPYVWLHACGEFCLTVIFHPWM